jgi:hypothetical protein
MEADKVETNPSKKEKGGRKEENGGRKEERKEEKKEKEEKPKFNFSKYDMEDLCTYLLTRYQC